MRDELVREVADRLDVPAEYVRAAGPAPRRRVQSAPLPAGTSAGEVAFRAEREFLVRCLATGALGHDFLARPDDEQLLRPTRRAREHLLSNFDDPLANLPDEDPALAAFVTDIAYAAGEQGPSEEHVLQMSLLHLEQRRIEREIRRAVEEGDHKRQSALAAAEQEVRAQLGEVMGQTA